MSAVTFRNVDIIFVAAAVVVVASIAAPGVLHLVQRRRDRQRQVGDGQQPVSDEA